MYVGGKTLGYGAALFVEALCLAGSGRVIAAPAAAKRTPSGIIETANFRVVGISTKTDAARIGAALEARRRQLCATWLGRELSPWSPKCHVVAHASAAGYARAVGPQAFATLGASSVDFLAGKVTRRRIDVRADHPGWFAAVVPHELTHLIMADQFPDGGMPHWADEGMATLADTAVKQKLHQRDFDQGRRGGRMFSLPRLLSRVSYPAADQVPVYYGQSAALVKFLVERQSAADFVRFLRRGADVGYDAAVAEVYGLAGLAELERAWNESLKATGETRRPVALTGSGKSNRS